MAGVELQDRPLLPGVDAYHADPSDDELSDYDQDGANDGSQDYFRPNMSGHKPAMLSLGGLCLTAIVVYSLINSKNLPRLSDNSHADLRGDVCNVFCKGNLLRVIQTSGIFNHSKEFIDMSLKVEPDLALLEFGNLQDYSVKTLTGFIYNFFNAAGSDLVQSQLDDFTHQPRFLERVKDIELRNWASSIHGIWQDLARRPIDDVFVHPMRHSLMSTRHPVHVIAGGRFRETYYWDSYWIVRGLLVSGMVRTAQQIVENLLDFVDDNGFVPNGSRHYYLNRSQPPLLTLMVHDVYRAMVDQQNPDASNFLQGSLSLLHGEYLWWMKLSRHAIEITVNERPYILNRYWSDASDPRPEMYFEDFSYSERLNQSHRTQFFRERVATAETGWDFSSRWQSDPNSSYSALASSTLDIIPVDLNHMLCRVEANLEHLYQEVGQTNIAESFRQARWNRLDALYAVLWNEEMQQFVDYNHVSGRQKNVISSSNFIPLWGDDCFQGHPQQKATMASLILSLHKSGLILQAGIATTAVQGSGQQWDWPDAWAPVQHMIIEGLAVNDILGDLHREIARRWLQTNYLAYKRTGFMHEKYDASRIGQVGGGGEYVPQTGFGWTNGVALSLIDRFASEISIDTAAVSECATFDFYDCQVLV